MLKTENISYSIGKKQILSNINAEFLPGEFNMILGPNGSGKSTFLKIFSGELNGFDGRVLYTGKKIVFLLERNGISHISIVIDIGINQFYFEFIIWFFSKTLGIAKRENIFSVSDYSNLSSVPGIIHSNIIIGSKKMKVFEKKPIHHSIL